MPSLDFEGDYGRTYRQSVQNSIPGHDVLHEIARAAIQTTASDAQQVLVVGPGPGDDLPHLLNACTDAALTVLEPSAPNEILTTVARGKFLKAINIDINAIKPAKHLFKCKNGRLVL